MYSQDVADRVWLCISHSNKRLELLSEQNLQASIVSFPCRPNSLLMIGYRFGHWDHLSWGVNPNDNFGIMEGTSKRSGTHANTTAKITYTSSTLIDQDSKLFRNHFPDIFSTVCFIINHLHWSKEKTQGQGMIWVKRTQRYSVAFSRID